MIGFLERGGAVSEDACYYLKFSGFPWKPGCERVTDAMRMRRFAPDCLKTAAIVARR